MYVVRFVAMQTQVQGLWYTITLLQQIGTDCRQGRLAVKFKVSLFSQRNVVTIGRGGKHSARLGSAVLEARKVYVCGAAKAGPEIKKLWPI